MTQASQCREASTPARRSSRVHFSAMSDSTDQAAPMPAPQHIASQTHGQRNHIQVAHPPAAQPHFRQQASHFVDWQNAAYHTQMHQGDQTSPCHTSFVAADTERGGIVSESPMIRSGRLPFRDTRPPPFSEIDGWDDRRRDSDSTLTDLRINATVGEGQSLEAKEEGEAACSCQEAPDVALRPALKPALLRRDTEEDPSTQAAREANFLVDSHTPHQSQSHKHHQLRMAYRRDKVAHEQSMQSNPYDWSKEDEEAIRPGQGLPKAGVLSNLLKLTTSDLKRTATASSWASATSVATSRAPSHESRDGHTLRQRPRRGSDISTTSVYPFQATQKTGDKSDFESNMRRGASTIAPWNAANDEKEAAGPLKRKKQSTRKLRRLSITVHVTDLLLRHKFILKLAKALMTFGAPSHRIESQLNAISDILDVDGHFVHLPSIVIASFGDPDTHTTETHFVKAGGGLNLGSLTEVHEIFRQVAHDEIGVDVGLQHLTRLLNAKPVYGLWIRVLIAMVCAGSICMLGFSGSFVDGLISAVFGGILAFLQIRVAASNPMYSNIFEISMATLVSFAGRGLSTTQYFCYEAISSSGVVLILPGYVILCGSLELASRNLIAGSVKLVYSIIYSLFLGFGIAIGSDLYYLFDRSAQAQAAASASTTSDYVTALGVLNFGNTSFPSLNGTFTLTNATVGLAGQSDDSAALQSGNVFCYRDPSWQWWRQGVSPWWAFLLVPLFSTALSLWNLQPVRDRQFPIMIGIAILGWLTNRLANIYIFNRSDIVSFIGSFVIGICGNLYSRIWKGTAFTAMVTGVLFLVPSGIAAAGGLAITQDSSSDSYSSGLLIGFRMIQVAIGITVGLFFASFLIYSFFSGRKRSAALFAF